MSRRIILPAPSEKYNPDDERIRNREIEITIKSLTEKIAELESRIYALENP
jgi:hypothetical protein